MSKPLVSDQPYPSYKDVTPDVCALKIISPAYASSTGEVNAVMQYIYHSMCFSRFGKQDVADTVEGIAIAEMRHMKLLGNTIYALGAQPVFTAQPPFAYNFYSTKFVSYSRTLRNMIEDDILAERHAIAGYERMLCKLQNERVKAIIARILEDEKLHLAAFEEIFKGIC